MKLKTLYAIPFLIVFLTACAVCVSAYSYQIPVCNSTLNTSCIPITTVSSITNAPRAIIYFQDGNLYITNDTLYPNLTTVINNSYYYNGSASNITNIITNVTHVIYNYTYIINFSNGSSFILQPNVTLDEEYVVTRMSKIYSLSNFSRFYNKSEIDNTFATQSQVNSLATSLGSYATKGDLINFDTRLVGLSSNLNSMNWSAFNLTEINEHMDNGGDFSTTWRTIVIIEGVVILFLLIFVARAAMSGGGEF